MNPNMPQGPHHSSTGCWTCRLRRKKCDENRPLCDTCTTLHITCHYGHEKPVWMDGGVRQEAMAEQLKREVKEKAHLRLRRKERKAHTSISSNGTSAAEIANVGIPREPATSTSQLPEMRPDNHAHNSGSEQIPEVSIEAYQRKGGCTLANKNSQENTGVSSGRPDIVLLTFYLENVFSFLFPFYRPSVLQGGRSWILELMLRSPVFQRVTLCQSSYFFSLARGTTSHDVGWETVLTQTMNAFETLRKALRVIDSSSIAEHIHGTVRILTSIMQVQRFDLVISGYENCQSHLNAALALFVPLLESASVIELTEITSSFNTIFRLLGPSSLDLSAQSIQIPSAEQAAFRFSSALLIFDDIIAGTALQEQPKLYGYHHSLLASINGRVPSIDLEPVIGCQNWVLLQIGEIATLDTWKQRCKRAGNLDVMELVQRAAIIKESLEIHLTRLETDPIIPQEVNSIFSVLGADSCQQSRAPARQSSIITRIWAHAARLYLFVVVSGWQPANADVRHHINRILELLMNQLSPPALLRTVVWPFCVAGCLAEPAQEPLFRGLVDAMQPPSVFGTVRKALDIMEHVWANRNADDTLNRDLAACFRRQGDLVLLV